MTTPGYHGSEVLGLPVHARNAKRPKLVHVMSVQHLLPVDEVRASPDEFLDYVLTQGLH